MNLLNKENIDQADGLRTLIKRKKHKNNVGVIQNKIRVAIISGEQTKANSLLGLLEQAQKDLEATYLP